MSEEKTAPEGAENWRRAAATDKVAKEAQEQLGISPDQTANLLRMAPQVDTFEQGTARQYAEGYAASEKGFEDDLARLEARITLAPDEQTRASLEQELRTARDGLSQLQAARKDAEDRADGKETTGRTSMTEEQLATAQEQARNHTVS